MMTAARRPTIRIALLAAALAAAGCSQRAGQAAGAAPLKITLATFDTPYSALIAVADDQGFFGKAGLDVTITLHPSGREALQAAMNGQAQVATVADIAFAGAIGGDPSLRVIGAIGASWGSEIVARADRQIARPEDLKGKRVGYSPGTSSAYHLRSFLLTNGLSPDDVQAVAVAPSRQVDAVVSGEVDAVSAFDVYAFAARKKLGPNAVAWDIQNTIEYQWLLATREGALPSLDAARRLLAALAAAEDFAVQHPEDVDAILTRKWNADLEFIRYSRDRVRLFVTLNQSVVTGLRHYAKWHASQAGPAGRAPDVLSIIDAGPMDALDGRRVTLFR